MASIHIKEIQAFLAERAGSTNQIESSDESGFFLEIRFDDPSRQPSEITDDEFANKVLTVDCAYGTATLSFDPEGLLKAIDIS